MSRFFAAIPPASLPVDASELAVRNAHERASRIAFLTSRADAHHSNGSRLREASANAFPRGTSVALASMGALCVGVALLGFAATANPMLAWILVTTLTAGGLLLTDRRTQRLVGSGRLAAWRLAVMVLLTTVAVVLLAGAHGVGPTSVDWSAALIDSLLSWSLVLLPGFTVDELTRRRGMRHQARAALYRWEVLGLTRPLPASEPARTSPDD